jgi:hypothetical protein
LVGGGGIALDSNGSAYVTNKTTSSDLPVTAAALDKTFSGVSDAFVAKLSPAGNAFAYLTYLGGSDDLGLEEGFDITVDSAGQAYVTGYSRATNFPLRNSLKPSPAGVDIFVTKLNKTGSNLLYSTFYGGLSADYGFGIALDEEENIYVTGSTISPDFPTKLALQSTAGGGADAYVVKLNPGGGVIYSTYLGGEGGDDGHAIVADNQGDKGRAYVVGEADDTFPVQNAAQPAHGGGVSDGFVAKIDDVTLKVYLPLVIK